MRENNTRWNTQNCNFVSLLILFAQLLDYQTNSKYANSLPNDSFFLLFFSLSIIFFSLTSLSPLLLVHSAPQLSFYLSSIVVLLSLSLSLSLSPSLSLSLIPPFVRFVDPVDGEQFSSRIMNNFFWRWHHSLPQSLPSLFFFFLSPLFPLPHDLVQWWRHEFDYDGNSIWTTTYMADIWRIFQWLLLE